MLKEYILVIDEGTTSTRALIFDKDFRIISQDSMELNIFASGQTYLEQDANEIFQKTVDVCSNAIDKAGILPEEILCMGITNQRGTSIAWDKITGEPLCRAINWADARTEDVFRQISNDGWLEKISNSMVCPVCGVPMINLYWLINNNETVKKKYEKNEIMFGTVDTWLIYKFTGGSKYITSYSNVSMYNGFDLVNRKWHEEYLNYLGIDASILPEVVDDCGELGYTIKELFGAEILIAGDMADQQSATFAHRVVEKGMMKCTCGTGAFVDICVGGRFVPAPRGLFPIATYIAGDKSVFQIEGCVKSAGSVLTWIRDDLKLIGSYAEIEPMALSVPDSNGVFFIPALSGLGAPYWNAEITGTFTGLSRSTRKAHMVRAALEGIAFRIKEICEMMKNSCGIDTSIIRIDGGLSKSDFFCQTIADFLNVRVERNKLIEVTALGAAEISGIYTRLWNEDEINSRVNDCDVFIPDTAAREKIDNLYGYWNRLIKRML